MGQGEKPGLTSTTLARARWGSWRALVRIRKVRKARLKTADQGFSAIFRMPVRPSPALVESQVCFKVLPANPPSEHSIDKVLCMLRNVDHCTSHSHEGGPDLSLKLPVSQAVNARGQFVIPIIPGSEVEQVAGIHYLTKCMATVSEPAHGQKVI